MNSLSNIFLIGGMGAGKTTIGRKLASLLNYQFYDSDKEIERLTGVNIAWIFEIEGEAGFRKREEEVIKKLSMQPKTILATGGGAILSSNTRAHLKKHGTVIYLKTTVEHQLQRLSRDKQRPLLQVPNRQDLLTELMIAREALYCDTAHFIVETDMKPLHNVVQHILKKLQQK